MRKIAMSTAGLIAATAALLFSFSGVALAHHVFFDVNATGAKVPGGGGDPNGGATAVIDFDESVSNVIHMTGTTSNLGTIVAIEIVNRTDQSVLINFGTNINTDFVATAEQIDALHDHADEYYFLITTQDFDEGAVAGDLVERPPTTTTSTPASSTSSSSTSSTSTTLSPTTSLGAAAVTATPRFTG